MNLGPGGPTAVPAGLAWASLRSAASRQAGELRAVLPAGPGCCAICRGRLEPGFQQCYNCRRHRQRAPRLLADLVVPITYSIGGASYSDALWQYKSPAATVAQRASARAVLRLMLLVFLHDHGPCLWSRAGVPAPTHAAVVPRGSGRTGPHPLRSLAEPYLRLPWADLATGPGQPALSRQLRLDRFQAAGQLAGATVLLLEDTWVSGSSAQSAAAALKLAGARSVVTVLLGRHLNPSDPRMNFFLTTLAIHPFQWDTCAAHDTAGQISAA